MLKTENYFEILGIREDASEQDIKRAYFTKIRQYSNEKYPEEFRIISEAYQVLSDPEKRERYVQELKDGGLYKRLMDEANSYYNSGKYRGAKLALVELMRNGYEDDLDVLLLYKSVCQELGDATEEGRIIHILESTYAHVPIVKEHLYYYYRATYNFARAIRYAKELIAIDPSNNAIFISLVFTELDKENYGEVFRLLRERINDSPVIIQNLNLYEKALLIGIDQNNDAIVRRAVEKMKQLAQTNDKELLLQQLVDIGSEIPSDAYAFKFYTLLIEELNAGEYSYIQDWTNEGRRMFQSHLNYYALGGNRQPAQTNSRERNPEPRRTPPQSGSPTPEVARQGGSYSERDGGSLVAAIIIGIIIAMISGSFWVGVIAGVVWYFFAGCLKSLLSCLVIFIIVAFIAGLIFG